MIESAHNVGRPRVITEEIERKIKEYWSSDPGIFCWEIRERLLTESVCQQRDLPSLSSISRVLKEKMIKSTVAGPRRPLLAEDSYPTAPYTRFTIANILGLRSHAVEISKAEGKFAADSRLTVAVSYNSWLPRHSKHLVSRRLLIGTNHSMVLFNTVHILASSGVSEGINMNRCEFRPQKVVIIIIRSKKISDDNGDDDDDDVDDDDDDGDDGDYSRWWWSRWWWY